MKHACEVVIIHVYFGSQTCGVEATKTIEDPWGYKDEVYICDEHFAQDVMLRRPYPMDYDFYYHVNDPGYDPKDWDEDVYREDLQKWMELKAQIKAEEKPKP